MPILQPDRMHISLRHGHPDDLYTYITGESLGATWDELSRKEKQIAVEKAKADAVTDVQEYSSPSSSACPSPRSAIVVSKETAP